MKTVPTLCATATAVGASAVGLSIGRPVSNKGISALANERLTSENDTMLMTPYQHLDAHNTSLTSRPSSTVETSSHDGRPSRLARRMTTSNTTESRLGTGRTRTPIDDAQVADALPDATLRTRPSWMKRLSNYSSQASSHEYDSRPASPSISYSNTSMAFSNAGSTAPIIGHPLPAPLAPNKLVKRSTSVRAFKSTPRPTSSRMPTLRRPATSHQRSATLQYQTSLVGNTLDEDYVNDFRAPKTRTSSEVQYTQFFSSRATKSRTSSSKKKNINDDMKPIKRVLPDAHQQPTLLLAKSVVACTVEVDDLSSQDGDSIDFSRPGTPAFTNIPGQTQERGVSLHVPKQKQEEGTSNTKVRRSFSISDYLSSGPQSRKQRTEKQASNKLLRKTSKRTTSAPLPRSLAAVHDTELRTGHDRNRRDIADPVISLRNICSSQAGSPVVDRPLTSSPNGIIPGETSNDGTTKSDLAPRHPRLSTAASEQASTLVGSDHDLRDMGSGEEEDLDFQSDTVFDSIRTRATRSTSSARGPRIETIFPDSSPTSHKANMQSVREIVFKDNGQTVPLETFTHAGIMEEDECTSSPGRTTTATERFESSPPKSQGSGNALFSSTIPPAAPDHPKALNLGRLEWDHVAEEEGDDDRWSFSGDEADTTNQREVIARKLGTTSKPSTPITSTSNSLFSTPRQHQLDPIDRDARSSIFDWSEQRPSEKSPGSLTPPRPSTVHGKKDADVRGSRAMGRRAPSGLHARSQSVPVVPDLAGKRDTVVTNKFGTWGVGSKGVTEDWNDDFDFAGPNEPPTIDEDDTARVDSGFSMFVPKSIREQQSNVIANIGLLREWGLLIEELKELRIRAVAIGLLNDQNKNTWHEVDAMIELADQEADDDPFGGNQSPTSSPGLDLDEFDDLSGIKFAVRTPRKVSASKDDIQKNSPALSLPQGKSRRKSILTANKDLFQPSLTPPPSRLAHSHTSSPAMTPPVARTTRPRKDSEAVALSVIEALKRKGTMDPPSTPQPVSPTKKVPFDTATLKHIVPYVSVLMRRVKEELRNAEGLYTSPNHSPKRKNLPLGHLMNGSAKGSLLNVTHTAQQSPSSSREHRAKFSEGSESPYQMNESEIVAQMKATTVM